MAPFTVCFDNTGILVGAAKLDCQYPMNIGQQIVIHKRVAGPGSAIYMYNVIYSINVLTLCV